MTLIGYAFATTVRPGMGPLEVRVEVILFLMLLEDRQPFPI